MTAPDPAPLLSWATAEALELPTLLGLIAELAASDLGRQRIVELAPAADAEELRARRERYEEAGRLLEERRLVAGFDRPLSELIEQLDTGRPPMNGPALVRLADLIKATEEARQRVRQADPPVPELAALVAELPELAELARRIGKALDRRGQVREDASPLLSRLRGRIRSSRNSLYENLGRIVGEQRDNLSEETIPMRGGRLMLVLSSGSRGRMPGLVHGRSGTGKSFYFEPLEVVESNNELQGAVEEEEEERQRIVNELVGAARQALPDLYLHAEFLAELDLLQAAVLFAGESEGRLAELAPRGQLRMTGARHPLLDPRLSGLREAALGQPGHTGRIVPLELELLPERRLLVVTGPNAGGKTVALKTLGLLAAAHQCGLPIPVASGTRIPPLDRLVATVGDEQDLLTDRSTFSGRLLRLKEAWEAAGPDSLVLLDELGSGTDPEEGAALSIALVEALLGRSALSLITTHLTPLAAAALEMDGAGCAAMGLDPDSGEPTFRLLPGPPGGSEAIALAHRLGLPAAMLERAESYLGSEHRELRRLLAEVEKSRRELTERHAELERQQLAARSEAARLEQEREAAEEERRQVGKRLKHELEEFRRETRQRLRQEVERLREELEAGRRKGLSAKAEERLFEGAPQLADEEPEEGPPIALGGKVRHRGLGWEGTLESLDGGRAEIRVKGKRVRLAADELVGVEEPKKKSGKSSPAATAARRAAAVSEPDAPDLADELMLIGKRVEPALVELDGYLDGALLAGRGSVRVVHGHGTGALRKAVRQHLKRHRAVARFRGGKPNEGGDGATVVSLKGG